MKSPQTRDTTKFKAVEEQEVDILIKMVESRWDLPKNKWVKVKKEEIIIPQSSNQQL